MRAPSKLDELIAETVTALGFEYVGCEYFPQSSGVLMRVYAEKPGAHISIDECASVSRQINATLAVEETGVPENYTLEVSSPGIERPLFKTEQYAAVVGQNVKVKLYHPKDGQRNFVGVLTTADPQQITLDVAGQPMEFIIAEIEKARLVVEFDI